MDETYIYMEGYFTIIVVNMFLRNKFVSRTKNLSNFTFCWNWVQFPLNSWVALSIVKRGCFLSVDSIIANVWQWNIAEPVSGTHKSSLAVSVMRFCPTEGRNNHFPALITKWSVVMLAVRQRSPVMEESLRRFARTKKAVECCKRCFR